ncbi:hypothetical protein [Paenibacillus sp. FSL K6-2524]|uniref:hypothetical protein n=1 Tax=Paenibacillus sp. FSL K6-2524 TaxID=2954516 RepID=UPI0030FA0F0E
MALINTRMVRAACIPLTFQALKAGTLKAVSDGNDSWSDWISYSENPVAAGEE